MAQKVAVKIEMPIEINAKLRRKFLYKFKVKLLKIESREIPKFAQTSAVTKK